MAGKQGMGLTTMTTTCSSERRCTDGGGFPDTNNNNNNNNNQGEKDDLYTELWYACAGPHVYVPRPGEKVFYFPQGHMEQVEAYANQDGRTEMPIYNLPSKILCKVVYVQLKAEVHSDEVFAQITLLPLTEQDEQSLEDETARQLPQRTGLRSFSKKLTPSDTSTHGGFSVPKRYADEYLPPLVLLQDMSQQPPLQELVAVDLHGLEWHFRHIFRGQPKRHLLTSGWSTFVTSKKLLAGDACVFVRGENGELRVGIRRCMATQNNTSATVISGQSMQHGILASACHAVTTGTMFTVYYRPWTSPAEYIIPFDKYMKSAQNDYFVGMRFRIRFEGEESAEKRSAGTIVGIEDRDCMRWPNSEWRRLKVQWDAATDAALLPESLSPWSIKPMESTNTNNNFVIPQPKRARAHDLSSTDFSNLAGRGLLPNSVEYTLQRCKEVLQGQEIGNVHAHEPAGAQNPSLLPNLIKDWNHTQFRMKNQLYLPMQNPFYQCPHRAIAFPVDNMVTSSLINHCHPTFTTYSACDNVTNSRSFSVSNVNSSNSGSQECTVFEPKSKDETPIAQPNGCGRCMLFGVNLVNSSHPELPSPQVATSSEHLSPCSIPPTSQSSVSETIQVSETSKSISRVLSNKQCKKCCSVINRSCTKVLKYGTVLGRSVDLSRFDGYDDLISELDLMFDFNGSLKSGSNGWQVSYIDNERDMMLLGDCQWEKFCSAVQRMFICPKEEIDKSKPSSSLPPSL
ncbi:auxin response factor 23 isoform X1 [Ziziphus jujuba]|uniref:Auxin response factor n=2 Tax=Ziziphus jujuba TaxID=326968 RepID=A0ABM3IVM8_ZIZJJ|nr:auxin response factor 23 isoform X1 [Ziziphus jujuba]XP_048336270.2 auxin response factor 23 isoform X1 [Ziziphus jujuba]XP_048336271.2 auxin response factor 23 isoform X1 [Ziziphus jujuba]